jgi:hypothetical protein
MILFDGKKEPASNEESGFANPNTTPSQYKQTALFLL